ncbi:MAG: hypothetical protein A2017_16420 [Lentisphaerae bacterium GWF2_44_16]|nr:MAG: hypothetical protein A2017_16420 [Lentisphaerae bacterium GWF2_44_16]
MFKRVFFRMLAVSGILCFSCLRSFAAEDFKAEKTDTAPVIDGKLDDPCWQNEKWYGGSFRVLNIPEQKINVQTKFKLAHDDANLYVAIVLDEPSMDKLLKKIKGRDESVFRDDCVEIFLSPSGEIPEYYHFAVSASGEIYDAFRSQGGIVATPAWNLNGIRQAVKCGEKEWTVELALPLLGLSNKSPDKPWLFNISRERKAGGKDELSSCAPLTGGFHQPSLFGKLTLENANLKKYSWKVPPFYDAKTISKKDGKIYYSFKAFLQNETGKYHFIKIKSSIENGSSVETTAGIDNKGGKEFLIEVPVGKMGNAELSFELTDRKDNTPMLDIRVPIQLNYSPMLITLIKPFYRDDIFASMKIKEIEGDISISTETSSKEIELSFKDENGKALTEKKIKITSEKMAFSLPLPENLADGKYYIEAKLIGDEKTVSVKKTVRKLAPFKGEVTIDNDLITKVDGKPFLAYGWFSLDEKNIIKEKDTGYNVTVSYNTYFKPDEDLKKWLDFHYENGIKVLMYPYPKRVYNNPESWHRMLSPVESEEIRAYVKKWKEHPAILGWYMADEPELRPALPARMNAIYEICKDEDPYHPCVLLNDTIGGIYKYIDSLDIADPDPYPKFLENGLASLPIEKVGQFIENIFKAGKNRKIAWATPQGFNYGDYGTINNRAPDFRELRNMQYQAIIAGCTGFTWYTYNGSLCYPDCKDGIAFLCKEANVIRDIVLSPTKRINIETGDTSVKAAYYKNIAGNDWIIAVNNATTEKKAKLVLPEKNTTEKWYVLSEGRSIEVKNGTIEHKFGIYDTEIYTTSKEAAEKLSVADLLKRIEEVKKSYIRPGDIAKEAKKISFSSNKGSRSAEHLTDGCRECMGWRAGKAGTQWVEFDFGKTTEIGRINAFSPKEFSKNPEIQTYKNGKWAKISELKKTSENKFESSFAPVSTDKIKIVFPLSNKETLQVNEIEIYKK